MEVWDRILSWFETYPIALTMVKYLGWLVLSITVIQLMRRLARRRISDTTARYRVQKGIEVIGYVLIIVITLAYFTGNIKDFALAIGLFSAGIAFTLQELVLGVAGSVFIFLVNVYKPGDRIELNSIKGDVIDIDSMYTTLMEIGEWVSTDNYTGRIVKVSNAFVFKGPVFNYSRDFPFIWDEFNLPIRYGSDIEAAQRIVLQVANEVIADYVHQSKKQWEGIVQKYYIENAQLDPTVAVTLTDNWMQLNVRYIVDHKKRRITKHEIMEGVKKAILDGGQNVSLASTTIEIVNPK